MAIMGVAPDQREGFLSDLTEESCASSAAEILDKRLDDRKLPFLTRIDMARDLFAASTCVAEREGIFNWTFHNLLKLSKSQTPKLCIFSSDALWLFLRYILSCCFPTDQPIRYTDISSRCLQIACNQPILPAFVCYIANISRVSDEFLKSLDYITTLFLLNRLDLGGQFGNYVELAESALNSSEPRCLDCCLEILACAYERSNTKKTLPIMSGLLPKLLSKSPCHGIRDKYLSFVLDAANGHEEPLSSDFVGMVIKLPACSISMFYKMYLQRLKGVLSLDKFRQVGFHLFRQLAAHSCNILSSLIRLLDEMNVYVHRNDSIYSEQSGFIKSLLGLDDVEALVAVLYLDYYLVVSEFSRLHEHVLNTDRFQSELFGMAVKSREVDQVVKLLRERRVLCNQGLLYSTLSRVDQHMLKFYEGSISSSRDPFWEVLVYMCDYGDLEERLACLSQDRRNFLLRFCQDSQPPNDEGGGAVPDLRNVPNMDAQQFGAFLGGCDTDMVFEMLSQPQFYEIKALRRPFERWLRQQRPAIQSRCIGLLPHEYLSTRTCKALVGVPGSARLARRRPKVLMHAIEHSLLDDPEIRYFCCRHAVKADLTEEGARHLRRLMQICPETLLSIRPIRPDRSAVMMERFVPSHRFIPHVRALNRSDLLQEIAASDSEAVRRYPHLYSIPLAQVDTSHAIISSAFGNYSYEEQLECLVSNNAFASDAAQLNRLLGERSSRDAAVAFVASSGGPLPLSTAKLLIPMSSSAEDARLFARIMESVDASIAAHLDDAIECMSLLVRHRAATLFSPRFVAVFLRQLLAALAQLLASATDTLVAHDFVRILADIGARHRRLSGRKMVADALLVFVVRLGDGGGAGTGSAEVRQVVEAGVRGCLRRVLAEAGGRALAWASSDECRLHLSDTLL